MDPMCMKQKDITTSLNISQGAVSKTLKRIRNKDFEGDLRSRKRSGRPLEITPRTDARIKRIVQDDPTMSSVDIVSELNLTEKISARTIRHHLMIKLNFKAVKPAKSLSFLLKICETALTSVKNTKRGHLKNG
ncbi:hypothetical protein LOD99_5406 [Oopsacas minuta]|uniref:Transposase Tc1-like domain-containing protein n=1 Tax=Oopsacas minuta TaxID=111878 RepID=A0AAV7JRU2_9METZ|nr:hypothetical protein LOD99_5406 [Oopsacas minuta]